MAAFIASAPLWRRVSQWPPHHRGCPQRAASRARRGAPRATYSGASPTSPPDVRSLVHAVLSATANSDGGARLSTPQRRSVEASILALNQIGRYRRNPLTDDSIFANYSVVYTSQRGDRPAAGGAFRSAFARAFLRDAALFQHLLPPNVAVNLVCFRALGVLRACVALRGTFAPEQPQGNMVRVRFERPRIRVGNAVFEFGSPSSVRLAATYLDERVRLGVGGRGSLFVFAKDEQARSQLAQQWRYIFDAKPASPLLLLMAPLLLVAALFGGAWPVRLGSLLGLLATMFILGRRQAQQTTS